MENNVTNSRAGQNPKSPLAQRFDATDVRYIGEQNGLAESELKTRLIQCFQTHQSIERAYLATIRYGKETSTDVALLLREQGNDQRAALCGRISGIFGAMFGSHEHLDIIFLTKDEEAKLTKVCTPFFALGACGGIS